jgi:hypothetical protein
VINPYESKLIAERQLTIVRRPWMVCLTVTFASMVVWLSMLGVSIFAWLSVVAIVVIALVNATVISPFCADLFKRYFLLVTILHVGIILAVVTGPFYWPSLVRQNPTLRWTLYPSYLILSWVPPILLGSLFYTVVWNLRMRQSHRKAIKEGGDGPVAV